MKDPYQAGWLAGHNGQPLESNPYDAEGEIDYHCDWAIGWRDAVNGTQTGSYR